MTMEPNNFTQARILLVEDDYAARVSWQQILEDAGYCVTSVSDGESACRLLQSDNQAYDVVLTDLALRATDGIEVLRSARDCADPPEVVLLTGRGTLETALAALRAGVYDYLLKPCKPGELLRAIAGALQRRRDLALRNMMLDEITYELAQLQGSDVILPQARYLHVGELSIDRLSNQVTFKGRIVQLTPTEYDLLCCLAEAKEMTLSFHDIACRTYANAHALNDDESHQLIKTHVHNLRRKIDPAYIVNVRGVGYRLVNPHTFGEYA